MTVILRTLFLVFLIVLSTAVRSQDDAVFSLVRDASELKEGDEVIIAAPDVMVAMSKNTNSAKDAIYSAGVIICGDKIIADRNVVQTFLLESYSTKWIFSTGTLCLGCSENKDKDLSFYDKKKNNYTGATITIGSDGQAEININGVKIGYNTSFKLFTATIGKICLYKRDETISSVMVLDGSTQAANNSDVINVNFEKTVDFVALQRTFVGDGGWYTLCLPFALTADDIATQFKGADFQKFTGVTMNADNTFNLEFRSVSQTRAGVPYLVRPIKGTKITDPVFTDKLISEAKPVTVVVHALQTEPFSEYSFTGIYNSTDLFAVDPSANQTIRFVNADGTQLVRPINDGTKLKATRAYVKLPSADTKAMIRHHEGETDGIQHTMSDSQSRHAGVYDLGGRYVGPSAEGLERGVYIVDGRKIMMK